ncbi:MAG: ABC transporter transmembrane domain-containing protein, partial [Bacteroidia bacterium]|nr:ABC transporter transmembrane domain-containing protein [Bacteroidia bacterium]
MKILFSSLKPYFLRHKKLLIWGIIFTVISNWFSIYPAQVVRHAFDLIWELLKTSKQMQGFSVQKNINEALFGLLPFFGLLIVALAALRGYFLYLVRQTLIVMSRKIEYEQKNELFAAMLEYDRNRIRKMKTGDLMARIGEDVANVRMFVGPGVMYTVNTVTLFIMILVTMIYVNAELTLYAMLPMPILGLSIYWVHSIIIQKSDEKQKHIGRISAFVQEAFSGIGLIKAFGRETIVREKFACLSQEYKRKSLNLILVDAVFMPLIALLVGVSTVMTVWIGSEKAMAGAVTIGNIAEFVIYINLLIWPVAALGWVTSLTNKAVSGQKRINEALNITSEIKYPEIGERPSKKGPIAVEFRNVNFAYDENQAIKNLSFKMETGKMYAMVGRTGSGKTTILQLITRIFQPQSGTIEIFGTPIENYSKHELRRCFSYVPQDVFLFSDTIAANIAFAKQEADRETLEKAARFAGIYDEIVRFPQGSETQIGE